LFAVEEAPLLWGHFVFKASSPSERNSEQQYSIQM